MSLKKTATTTRNNLIPTTTAHVKFVYYKTIFFILKTAPQESASLPPSPSPYSSSSSTGQPYPITRLSFAAQRPVFGIPSTTLAPPPLESDFLPTSTLAPNHSYRDYGFDNHHQNHQHNHQDLSGVISSTPRSFSVLPVDHSLQPDTVYITPKTFVNDEREYYNPNQHHARNSFPNSLTINRELLPPLVSVNALDNSHYHRSHNGNDYIDRHDSSLGVRPLRSTTAAPVTVKNFSYRSSTYKK